MLLRLVALCLVLLEVSLAQQSRKANFSETPRTCAPSCSCGSTSHAAVPHSWTLDKSLGAQIRTFAPEMAMIIGDLQKSAAQGHLCASMYRGQTELILGNPRTLVSWRYYSLRDGVDRLETDRGEVLEFSANRWNLYRNYKAVAHGPVDAAHGK